MTERLTEDYFDDMQKITRHYAKSNNIDLNTGGDDFQDIIDKLAKYETSEEEGRLVVLPCDTVYFLCDKGTKYAHVRAKSIFDLLVYDINGIDKDGRYWSVKAEAEKALKENEGNDNRRALEYYEEVAMQELEKILEEIDNATDEYGMVDYINDDPVISKNQAKEIIRKYMSGKDSNVHTNDGRFRNRTGRKGAITMTENQVLIKTPEEAIETIKSNMPTSGYQMLRESLEMAIIALKEVQQYREIGTVEECKELAAIVNKVERNELAKIIDEWISYRKIGTVEECREAMANKKKCEKQWHNEMENPLEPIKVYSALKSEILKLELRIKNRPKDISILDYTVIAALQKVLKNNLEGMEDE